MKNPPKESFEYNVIFDSLMEFFRKILKEALEESEESLEGFDNIYVSVIVNIMKENDLFDKTPEKVGMFKISEKEYIEKIAVPKNNNDELYDFCYWLDSKGYLEEYLAQKFCKKPELDRFYNEMNEKIFGITEETTVNANRKCPLCGMVPYYSFENICSHCHDKLTKYKFDDCLSTDFIKSLIDIIDNCNENHLKITGQEDLMECLEYIIRKEYLRGSENEDLILKACDCLVKAITNSL